MQQFCSVCRYWWGDTEIIVSQQESLVLLYSNAVVLLTEQQLSEANVIHYVTITVVQAGLQISDQVGQNFGLSKCAESRLSEKST